MVAGLDPDERAADDVETEIVRVATTISARLDEISAGMRTVLADAKIGRAHV